MALKLFQANIGDYYIAQVPFQNDMFSITEIEKIEKILIFERKKYHWAFLKQ